jgi:hypothetical protein
MKQEVEHHLAKIYHWLTWLSASLMLLGWLWHLGRDAPQNWVLNLGIGLLLLTPLLILLQLARLTIRSDKKTALYSLITIVLVGIAFLVGWWMSQVLGGQR